MDGCRDGGVDQGSADSLPPNCGIDGDVQDLAFLRCYFVGDQESGDEAVDVCYAAVVVEIAGGRPYRGFGRRGLDSRDVGEIVGSGGAEGDFVHVLVRAP